MQKTVQVEKPNAQTKLLEQQLADVVQKGRKKSELREFTIFVGLFAVATLGRVALQWVPSVEPIIPLAILAGFLFGSKEGFSLGAGAYVASNFFVWGMQGPWTLFQAIGAGIPGAIAGMVGKTKKPTERDLIIFSVLGTVFFEIVMNISGPIMGIGLLGALGLLSIPLYFVTSLPFSLVHISSNAVFAKLFSPGLKLRREKDELKIIAVSRIVGNQRTDVRLYKQRKQ